MKKQKGENMRLIDSDELMAKVNEIKYLRKRKAQMLVDECNEVEAVHVVRCKDCIHRPIGDPCKHNVQPPKENDYRCPCICEDDWYSWTPTDDWFCGNGERK